MLVVPVSPVPHDIDEDVLLEFLSILDSDLHAFVQNIGFITVDMDDWSIDCFGDFRAVVR